MDGTLDTNGTVSAGTFSQYQQNIDAFIDSALAPNIKQSGEIVRTPQQAKAESRTVLASLDAAYEDILSKVTVVSGILTAFNALDLAAEAMAESIKDVRADVEALSSYFSGSASESDKIKKSRDAYLRLAAGKVALNNLSGFIDPTEARLSSTSTRLIDAADTVAGSEEGETTAASTTCVLSAPWDMTTGVNDQLSLAVDGGGATLYTFDVTPQPFLTSGYPETWDITAQTTAIVTGGAPNFTVNAYLSVIVDGERFTGLLNGTFDATTIITAINTNVISVDTGFSISTVLTVTCPANLTLTHLQAGSSHSIIVTEPPNFLLTSAHTALGLSVLAGVSGTDANNKLQLDGLSPEITLAFGTGVAASAIAFDINTWVTANYPGAYLAADVTYGSATFLQITKTVAGAQQLTVTNTGSTPAVAQALVTFGFLEGQLDTSTGVSASEVASAINKVGEVTASTNSTTFDFGTGGSVTSATAIELPLNSVSDLNHTGDHLLISRGENAGYHRIVNITRAAVDTVVVEAVTPFLVYVGADALNQHWSIVRHALTLSSPTESMNSRLVIGAASANTLMGFGAGTYKGTTTGLRVTDGTKDVSLSQYFVDVGDVIIIDGATFTILELTDSNKQVEVDLVVNDAFVNKDFTILSAAANAYSVFDDALDTWETALAASEFDEDIVPLDQSMIPLLENDVATGVAVADAASKAAALGVLLESLSVVLEGFSVSPAGRMDAALRMLEERGLYRLRDLLLDGDIAEVFGSDKDEATYAGFMMKQMREVAREDMNAGTDNEDAADTQLTSTSEDTDADYDFSDNDDDEDFDPLGEVPELDDEELTGTSY